MPLPMVRQPEYLFYLPNKHFVYVSADKYQYFYESFKLFIGDGVEMREVHIRNVTRYCDGGTIIIETDEGQLFSRRHRFVVMRLRLGTIPSLKNWTRLNFKSPRLPLEFKSIARTTNSPSATQKGVYEETSLAGQDLCTPCFLLFYSTPKWCLHCEALAKQWTQPVAN